MRYAIKWLITISLVVVDLVWDFVQRNGRAGTVWSGIGAARSGMGRDRYGTGAARSGTGRERRYVTGAAWSGTGRERRGVVRDGISLFFKISSFYFFSLSLSFAEDPGLP